MIKISNLSFRFPQSSTPVLHQVNLEVQPGTLTLVAGASGSGKSTLLRCINGLVPHFSGGIIHGSIQVFGSDPIEDGPEAMAAKVGFVFQEPEAQFVFDVVEDEIAFALENVGVPWEEMHIQVDKVVRRMQLTEINKKKIHDISGGEMQKVAIASALVSHPQVLILDEPTSQLDPISADDVLKYIVSLKTDLGLTVLISEHRLERLLPYTDIIAFLSPEHTLAFGAPQEILPMMQQLPPVIEIAKRLNLSPLPLSPDEFPDLSLRDHLRVDKIYPEVKPSVTQPVLELRHLSASFAERQILSNVTFQLEPGEILILLGPNGAGKTTLLRSILGLISSEGIKCLFGQNMKELDLAEVIQHIAYLPQNPNDLLFAETVLDEMKITLKNHNLQMEDPSLVNFLRNFGLSDKQHQYPRDLSVGERQRTALAAITIHEPRIILLDEPTRGLDYFAKQNLSELLRTWRDQDRSILLVTHDIEFAAGLADRTVILEDGQILFTGSPRIAFTQFPAYRTQTAQLFPTTNWITPDDVVLKAD